MKLSGKRTAGDDCILNIARTQVSALIPAYADARDRKNDGGYTVCIVLFYLLTALSASPVKLRRKGFKP